MSIDQSLTSLSRQVRVFLQVHTCGDLLCVCDQFLYQTASDVCKFKGRRTGLNYSSNRYYTQEPVYMYSHLIEEHLKLHIYSKYTNYVLLVGHCSQMKNFRLGGPRKMQLAEWASTAIDNLVKFWAKPTEFWPASEQTTDFQRRCRTLCRSRGSPPGYSGCGEKQVFQCEYQALSGVLQNPR